MSINCDALLGESSYMGPRLSQSPIYRAVGLKGTYGMRTG